MKRMPASAANNDGIHRCCLGIELQLVISRARLVCLGNTNIIDF